MLECSCVCVCVCVCLCVCVRLSAHPDAQEVVHRKTVACSCHDPGTVSLDIRPVRTSCSECACCVW